MSQRQYIFVNGILGDAYDDGAWQTRAQRWVHRTTGDVADAYLYRAGPLTRWISQRRHARELADMIRQSWRPGRDMVLVGHSNGCDLICRAIRDHQPLPVIREAHLIAAAAEQSFEDNGLNWALTRGSVWRVFVYGSDKDKALRLGRLSRIARLVGLGYGILGLKGPLEVAPCVERRVRCLWVNDYGHSTWFDQTGAFDLTMYRIASWGPIIDAAELEPSDDGGRSEAA